ncbi:hypothetical protein [Nocardia sp. NPDC051463]|uniref:hypothetical protein n=1 Tax=Nocardia sp. NPDC051463 TaxID=3154845 RepID=UPI00344F1EE0
MGLITGFLLFVAAPLWLDAIPWVQLLGSRGAFALVAAAWSGLIVGYLTATGPPVAAVLAGLLTGAAVLMELALKVAD